MLKTLVGAVLGITTSAAVLTWVKHVLTRSHSTFAFSCSHVLFLCVCSAVSGTEVIGRPLDDAVILGSVSVLLVCQVPVDFALHRLMRWPTFIGTATICSTYVIDGLSSETLWTRVGTMIQSFTVPGLLALLARLRPQALGFGDVLLTVPLSLALTGVDVKLLLWWLLAASTTGALHGIAAAVKGRKTIPFGPHLLLWSWLFLLLNL